jgi:hypothetical protein
MKTDLDILLALEAKATAAGWRVHDAESDVPTIHFGPHLVALPYDGQSDDGTENLTVTRANAALICAMRNSFKELIERVNAAEAALEPFAKAHEHYADDNWSDGASIDEIEIITVGDLRRAAAALEKKS